MPKTASLQTGPLRSEANARVQDCLAGHLQNLQIKGWLALDSADPGNGKHWARLSWLRPAACELIYVGAIAVHFLLTVLHIKLAEIASEHIPYLTGPTAKPAHQGDARQWASPRLPGKASCSCEVWTAMAASHGSHGRPVWQTQAAASLCTLQGW